MKQRVASLVLLGLLAGLWPAAPVEATSVKPVVFADLVDSSPEIFVGQVVARRSQWVNTPRGQAIVTLVTFRIEESIKGGLLTETTLEFLGGTVGDTTMKVHGSPEFKVGDRDVVFVGLRNAVSPVNGFWQGRFRVTRDAVRGVDTVRGHDGRVISSTASIGAAPTTSLTAQTTMTLADFRAEIRSRIRANEGRIQ
mgnify:CR=1 FL=1